MAVRWWVAAARRWRVVGGVGGVGGGAVVVRGSEGGVAACVFGYITAISFVHFLDFVKIYTKTPAMHQGKIVEPLV